MRGTMGVDCLGHEVAEEGNKNRASPDETEEQKMRLDSESTDDGLDGLEPLELDDLRRYETLEDR